MNVHDYNINVKLKLQNNQTSRKQEMVRNQVIQQLNQLDTDTQNVSFPSENTDTITSTSKKVLPQQVAWSYFALCRPFLLRVNTERQKQAFITNAINFTENVFCKSRISLLFEKHCKDNFSILLIREHNDFFNIMFVVRLVNQVLLMYLSLCLLTQLQNLSLESS